jgi:GNAT superfamily N-acetyltransferase
MKNQLWSACYEFAEGEKSKRAREILEVQVGQPISIDRVELKRGVRVTVYANEPGWRSPVAKFDLRLLATNRYVAISSNEWVAGSHRRRGIGKLLVRVREQVCQAAECTLLMATVRTDNVAQIALLSGQDWHCLFFAGPNAMLWTKPLARVVA